MKEEQAGLSSRSQPASVWVCRSCRAGQAVRGLVLVDPGHDEIVLPQFRQEFGCLSRIRLDHYSTIYPLIFGEELVEVNLGVSLTPPCNLPFSARQERLGALTVSTPVLSISLSGDHLNLLNPHSISR